MGSGVHIFKSTLNPKFNVLLSMMLRCKVILVLGLALVTLTNGLSPLLQWDKESVYHYKAIMRAGTHVPTSYGSQFILEGKLLVQAKDKIVHFKLTDVHYKIYNGPIDYVHENEAQEVPIPQEVHELMKVFKVTYNEDGLAVDITTDAHEKEFTRNMKKSMASLWQMNVHHILDVEKPHGFMIEEDSIYGKHDVYYNVIPHSDVVVVQKMHEIPATYYFTVNDIILPVEEHVSRPFSHVAQHEYVIMKEGDKHFIKRLVGIGEMHYHLFEHPHTDAQYVYVNQTFCHMESHPVQEELKIENEHHTSDLAYYLHPVDNSGALPDITNGRRVINWESVLPKVQTMMKEVMDYFKVDHITTEKPDHKQAQLVNRLVRLMQLFDHQKMEELHNVMSQKTTPEDLKIIDVFYIVLPMVGTEASTRMIKKLVLEKKVNELTAVKMLHEMPRNVIAPSRELVSQMEDLIHSKDKVAWSVHKAAILSFGSLVYKAYVHEIQMQHQEHHETHHDVHHSQHHYDMHTNEQGHEDAVHHNIHEIIHHDQEHHETSHPNTGDHMSTMDIINYYDKYVAEYITHLRDTQHKEEQLVYFNGLYNMKIPTILTKMSEGINGVWWPDNDHSRFMSMWVVKPLVHSHTKDVYKIFWPILMNHHEHNVLRMFAYHMIMETHPARSTIIYIHWQMMKELDHDMYHFHYTYLQALMHSTEPSFAVFKEKAKHVMRYMAPPLHGMSSYSVIDYKDLSFNMGGAMHGMFMEDKFTKYIAIYSTSHVAHRMTEDHHASIKLHGTEHRLADAFHLKSNIENSKMMFNFEDFSQFVSELRDNIQIEIIFSRRQEVVNVLYFDKDNQDRLVEGIVSAFKHVIENHSETVDMKYNHYLQNVVITDIGVPAILEYLDPEVTKAQGNTNEREVENNMKEVQIKSKYKQWSSSRQGLTFYNPILDVWQGVNKYITIDKETSMNMQISANFHQSNLKLSFDLHDEDNTYNVNGIRYHVTSMVFVKDDQHRTNLLPSGYDHWTVVSHGNEYRHNMTLETIYPYEIVVFDTEYEIPQSHVQQVMGQMMQPYTKHFDSPLDQYILYAMNWDKLLEISPYQGTYGLMSKYNPTRLDGATTIDINMRLNRELKQSTHVYTPAMKYNTRVTYAIKNREQSLKTWDVNAILDMNDGHSVNDLKMEITRIIPGNKDFKVCIDGVKRYTLDGVNGHMNITMGVTSDGQCVKDNTVVDIDMVAEPSLHQRSGHYSYGACQYYVPYMPHKNHHHHTIQCMAEHTSVHKYVYTIKSSHVPSEFKYNVLYWWDLLKALHFSNYQVDNEHAATLEEDEIKVEVVYGMEGEYMDIHVYGPHKLYSLTGVPLSYNYWKWFGIYPDSTAYSDLHYTLHEADLVDHCDVYHDHLVHDHQDVHNEVSNEWKMYVGDVAENPKHAVYVKHIEPHHMAVKVVHEDHEMEVVPHEGTYIIKKNGQTVTMNNNKYSEDWIQMFVIEEEAMHPVIIHMPHFGFNVEFHSQNIYITMPKYEHTLHGYCYTH